jgi:molybdenum cofactor cytidylyltransferase
MTGIIILAAGASTRMGSPKQQLLYQGQTLLQRAIHTALSTACTPVIVVLGAHAMVISPEIPKERNTMIKNPDWAFGIGSSIRCGMLALQEKAPLSTGVILMVCDQPHVTTAHLQQLMQQKLDTGKGIIASYYSNTMGVPVLFDKAFFPQLQSLSGQEGAKKLLYRYEHETAAVPFPPGEVDVDTKEDYERL